MLSSGRASGYGHGSASSSRVSGALFALLCHSADPSRSADPHDSIFTAQLFVSDTEELYRCVVHSAGTGGARSLIFVLLSTSYTDDGDATALCRWTVDLAALPRFHYIAQSGGGYVE